MIGERTVAGTEVLVLGSDAAGGIEAAFAPHAGMVGWSLRHRGEELLGQRGGLRTYIDERSTMGIPLLHPWANRLARTRFELAGREVDLSLASPPPAADANGLPIHGLLAAAPGWRVVSHEATDDGGVLTARLDFAREAGLIGAFPYPHELIIEATLQGAELEIATTVRATGEAPVPISFGYHPYLRLPGVARSQWRIEVPVTERLALDRLGLSTGAGEPVRVEPGRLGTRTFDDEYRAPQDHAPFVLAGGGRRLELTIGAGYPFAQVYAPDDDDVIAYEPMTAPTNALIDGGPDLTVLEPGGEYRAWFSITVGDDSIFER